MKKITIIVAIAMAMVMGFYASSMPTYMLSGGVIISRNRLQNAYAEEIVDEEQEIGLQVADGYTLEKIYRGDGKTVAPFDACVVKLRK